MTGVTSRVSSIITFAREVSCAVGMLVVLKEEERMEGRRRGRSDGILSSCILVYKIHPYLISSDTSNFYHAFEGDPFPS